MIQSRGLLLASGAARSAEKPAQVARRGIVRSFQISATFAHLTVLDNVRIGLQRATGQSFHFWKPERVLDSPQQPVVKLADGRELHQVKLVGAVRSAADNSTNITSEVEDGTGLVEIKQWNDDNDCQALAEMRALCAQDHVYIKCVGQIKDYDGKKTLVADRVRIVNSLDEVTHHYLEVVYSAEKSKRADSFVGAVAPFSMRSGVGFGGAPVAQAGGQGGDTLKDQVLNFIKEYGGE